MEVENVNSKKLFPEKKFPRKSVVEFIEKKGFYIVLILCVAIIGATAVFLSTSKDSPEEPQYYSNVLPETEAKSSTVIENKTSAQPDLNSFGVDANKNVAVNAPAIKEALPPKKNEEKEPDPSLKNKATQPQKNVPKKNTPKAQNFIKPVFGEITYDFSIDKLVYSKTLEEWRTHTGVDLAAERGTEIKAVADGVVSEIKKDPRYGFLVILDHQNGLKTLYSNLAGDDMVTPNQKVKQGEVIGVIGSTNIIEALEQSHLHFEVWKDNEVVNPNQYLPLK